MKSRFRLILSVLIFVTGLVVGIRLGYLFGLPEGSLLYPIANDLGQRQFLVVGVDRLGMPQTRLQAVWFIAYPQDEHRASLIPLYPAIPAIARDPQSANQQVESAFRVRSDGSLHPDFLHTIETVYEIVSSPELIVLDDIAMMQIVDFQGGVNIRGEHKSGSRAVGDVTPAWVNPDQALAGQTELLEQLCQQISIANSSRNFNLILDLIPEHLQVERATTELALADWTRMLSNSPEIACEFPHRE